MNPIHYVLDARTTAPHFPGIGRYVRSLGSALVPLLDPPERLTLITDPQHAVHVDAVDAVHVSASPFSASQQWRLPQVLRSLSAQLYHSPYYLMPYRPGVRTVLTVYDVIPLRYPEFSSPRSRLLFRLTTRLALASSRHVIAITENARQNFISEFGISADRITAVPLAAGAAFHPQSIARIEAIRIRYQLPDRFVLYLGSNKPHKNLVGLVNAWSDLLKGGGVGGVDLVVAGAWDARYPEARELASALGDPRIRWIGPVDDADLPALYTAATAFVFPSRFEGFGLPVIEAMACGVPVICSNVTALPEVAGGAAILVDLEDSNALAIAIRQVLEDQRLRDDLRERGLARAAAFSWAKTAAQTLEIYRKTASQA